MTRDLNSKIENKVKAIVVAAGKGERLKAEGPKLLVKIKNKPILFFALKSLSRSRAVKEIIIVSNKNILTDVRTLVKKYNFSKVKNIIIGGPARKDSVANGLKCLEPDKKTFVLIHDAARPFINKSHIEELIKEAFRFNAAISAVKVKFTVKSAKASRGGLFVDRTLDRRSLWEIHTPQIFRSDLLFKAFRRFRRLDVTDDASLIERLGVRVKIVKGSYSNIKITTPEDLIFARDLAKHFDWDY